MSPWSRSAGVPESVPSFSLFPFLQPDTDWKLHLLQVFCPLQAQGVWDHLAVGDSSSQLPSAPFGTRPQDGLDLVPSFRSGFLSLSIFISDVETCILDVRFLKSTPWVCSWPVNGYAWLHLGINELASG